jgi:hypothetical protein
MRCPNGDPGFNNTLDALGIRPTPTNRHHVFWFVCIWVRMTLYSLAFSYRSWKWMPYLIGGASVLSILQLAPSLSAAGHQWWSKRFQLFIAVLLAGVSAAQVAGYISPFSIVPACILFGSLAGGILQASKTTFC